MTSMTVPGTGDEVLKMDALGRVRTSAVRREALLDEFERSGGSGAQFAALLGIKYATFASWIQSRRRQRRLTGGATTAAVMAAPGSAPVWLEAVLDHAPEADPARAASAPEVGAGSLRVELPGGAEVQVAQAGELRLLASLLRELARKEPAPC